MSEVLHGYQTVFPDGRMVALYYDPESEEFWMHTENSKADPPKTDLRWSGEALAALVRIYRRITEEETLRALDEAVKREMEMDG